MKIATKHTNVKSSGFGKQIGFSLKNSEKAFSIISDLYSDIIRAVIRELSTNAADVHIECGKEDVPFDIHLPSRREPYFCIRDYGTGLDPEEMETVFTVVFESTKADSNEGTGCFGLGCKSPLAYNTGSFIIESFKDGRRHLYNSYKNEVGIPVMDIMDESGTPTSEPNGLKITIAVKDSDIYTWQDRAQTIYRFFPVTPNFIGEKLHVNKPKYIYEGTNWKMLENGYSASVIMGKVEYPLTQFSEQEYGKDYEIAGLPIHIFVDIGDVDIVPSRENLNYHDRTKTVIKNYLTSIMGELTTKVEQELKNCKSVWEARCEIHSLYHIIPRQIVDTVSRNLTLFGQKLGNGRSITLGENYIQVMKGLYSSTVSKENIYYLPIDKNQEFYINDLIKPGIFSRSKLLVENHKDKKVLIATFDDINKKKQFEQLVGINPSDWKLASNLPEKVRFKNDKIKDSGPKSIKIPTVKVCTYISSMHNTKTKAWDRDSVVDISKGGYYIPLERYEPMHNSKSFGCSNLTQTLDCLLSVLGKTVEVVGVRKAMLSKIESESKWVNIIDYAKKELKNFFATNQHEINEGNRLTLQDILYNSCWLKCGLGIKDDLDINSPTRIIMEKIATLSTNVDKNKHEIGVNTARKVNQLLFDSKTVTQSKMDLTLIKEVKNHFSQFVLLSWYSRWENMGSTELEHLALYFSAIEN